MRGTGGLAAGEAERAVVAVGPEARLFKKILRHVFPGLIGGVSEGVWLPGSGNYIFIIEDTARGRHVLRLEHAPQEKQDGWFYVRFAPPLPAAPAQAALIRLKPGVLAALAKVFGAVRDNKLTGPGPYAQLQHEYLLGQDSESWKIFFAPEKVGDYYPVMCLELPIMFIYHSDFECYGRQFFDAGIFAYFNSPWCADAGTGARQSAAVAVTDLQQQDFVFGTSGKLAGALEMLAPGSLCRTAALVQASCAATVIGEDGKNVCKKMARQFSGPLLFSPFEDAELGPLLAAVLLHGVKLTRNKRCGINMAGFPRTRGLEDFLPVLADFGLTVNSVVSPRMERSDVCRYADSGWQMTTAGTPYAGVYSELAEQAGIKNLVCRGPYGSGNTKEWIKLAFTAVNPSGSFEPLWNKYRRAWHSELEGLKKKCEGHVLGFVGDAKTLEGLVGEGYIGFPIVDVIKELGFSLVFFSYQDFERTANGIKVVPFSTLQQLRDLLTNSNVASVFSDFLFDDRLSRTGKNQFSLKDFDVGLSGLVSTAQALLSSCECGFYREYGVFLNDKA